jgi:tol-pal system protein YbgF
MISRAMERTSDKIGRFAPHIPAIPPRRGFAPRIRLLAVLFALSLTLTGCLTRTAQRPGLPYVAPAQSVPHTDPTALHIAGRIEEMEAEIRRLNERVERAEASGNKTAVVELQERVAAIEKKLGMGASTDTRNQQQDRSGRVNPPPSQPENPQSPQPPQPVPAPGAERTGPPVELKNPPLPPDEKLFRDAFTLFQQNSFPQAVEQFEEFVKKYPKSHLAPDAIYWIGEAKINLGKYNEAVLELDRVIKDYPGSKKELNALLKQGEAFERMGDQKSAGIIFQKLVSEHPHTSQGRIAAAKLRGMKQQ